MDRSGSDRPSAAKDSSQELKCRAGLLGGSFNPVHIGHLRLAIEVKEALKLDHIDLIPCASPPHKDARGLLPFEMRAEMLEAAIRKTSGLRVNLIEGQRSGPSYTYDTLALLRSEDPQTEFYFILGKEDFTLLAEWHKGLELPSLCNFAIIPRGDANPENFRRIAVSFWRDLSFAGGSGSTPLIAFTRWGTKLVFIPLPRLEISASFLRERWLAGKDTSFLMPEEAAVTIQKQRDLVKMIWNG